MTTKIISLTNMSILYSSIHNEPIPHKPKMEEKTHKKVERTYKSNGGHFDARG